MTGPQVVLLSNPDRFAGPAAKAALEAGGATVVSVAGDPRAAVDDALAAHGRIDALVNNDAFPAIRAPVADASLDDLRAGLEAMLVAPFALTQAVVPAMRERKRGRIVFVTSATPLRGLPNYSMYVSARGAANALAVSLARELGRDNIQVNAVAPNYVENPDYFPPELVADAETLARIVKPIPLGRLGKPEELGATIAFLASPGAGYLTAQVISVAGGWA